MGVADRGARSAIYREGQDLGVLRAVIPAAGLGTRLYPATKSQPKEMLPLGTKPTIQLVAEELVGAGLRDLLIVIGRHKRAIADHFDQADGISPSNKCDRCSELFDNPLIHFYYTRQSVPKGLGDAVMQARTFVGQDHFVVALGDCVIVGPERSSLMNRLLQTHEQHSAAATIATQRVSPEATSRYGIVDPEGSADETALKLRDIVEKPGPDKAPSNLAVCARYVFSPVVFEYLDRTAPGFGGEVQLTDAIRAMIRDGLPVYAVPLLPGEDRLDVGNFESYAKAFIRLMLSHEELGPGLRKFTSELIDRIDG
jgi:UTP--glucose-1-phosphate uridylyltransferase